MMTQSTKTASQLIDARIADLDDWRGELLAKLRALIKEALPEVVEEWKWMGTPVWSLDGILCTGESYKTVVKTTFAKGASLADPKKLFNASLEGNARRAIDFPEGAKVDEAAFKALVRGAAVRNSTKPAKRKPDAVSTVSGKKPASEPAKKPSKQPAKQPAKRPTKSRK